METEAENRNAVTVRSFVSVICLLPSYAEVRLTGFVLRLLMPGHGYNNRGPTSRGESCILEVGGEANNPTL
jgi:hypothetical protein